MALISKYKAKIDHFIIIVTSIIRFLSLFIEEFDNLGKKKERYHKNNNDEDYNDDVVVLIIKNNKLDFFDAPSRHYQI